MKILISQADLHAALSLVCRAVGRGSSHPIMAGVLVETAGISAITLTGYDLAFGIRTTIPCTVEEPGRSVIPAALLAGIVAKLNKTDVLTLTAEPTGATLISRSGRYTLGVMDPEESPALPEATGTPVTLPSDALAEGAGGVGFAVSGDETKQILTGIHLTSVEGGLEFAATDGHRLAVYTATAEGVNDELTLTVPPRALAGLPKGTTAHLYYDAGQLVLHYDATAIISRLLDGAYPNYNALIPANFKVTVACDRRGLLASLDRVSAMAAGVVVLAINGDELTLSGESQGSSARELLPVQTTGDPVTFAVNPKYLSDALRGFSETEAFLQINTPTSPVVISPLGATRSRSLVMPVQIRS